MNISNLTKIIRFNMMLEKSKTQRKSNTQKNNIYRRDSFNISNAAKTTASNGSSRNRDLDNKIDLDKYINEARKANEESLKNAGDKIISNNAGTYTDNYHAFKAALTEKYSKLAETSKAHSDPENYVQRKYYDKTCSWYANDLSDQERRIACMYENQMLREGKIHGVEYGDSLFRGISVNGDYVDEARNSFNGQMINAQITNILDAAGINISEINDLSFSIDPYSYYISANGVDNGLRENIENALNVGENGKNLYHYIKNINGGVSLPKDSVLKYQAYQQVKEFTDLEINKLSEKDGSYFTDSGENIIDIIEKSVENSPSVPKTHKQQVKNWLCGMIRELSSKGWNNIPDLTLNIDLPIQIPERSNIEKYITF